MRFSEGPSHGPLIEQFQDKLRRMDPAVKVDKELLTAGMHSVIFGPTINRYLRVMTDTARPVERLSSVGEITPDLLNQTMTFLTRGAVHTERMYTGNRPGILSNPDFLRTMREHNQRLSDGDGSIVLVPDAFAMTPDEGEAQVRFADSELSKVDSRVQVLLAGANYAAFTPKTMQTGLSLLESGYTSTLLAWSERGVQDAMPHVGLANIAHGAVFSRIYSRASERGIPIQFVDLGSGSGATLAGLTLGLSQSLREGAVMDPQKFAIAGVECTVPMYETLKDFSEAAVEKIKQADGALLGTRFVNGTHPQQLQAGEMSFVHGDIIGAVDNLQLPFSEGLTGVFLNYAAHRLTTEQKRVVVGKLASKYPNIIVVIGDLVKNGSVVNRRYFNFRDNGLSNCPNTELDAILSANGLDPFQLNETNAPASMNLALARKIGEGVTSDSIFTIASKGPLARAIIQGW